MLGQKPLSLFWPCILVLQSLPYSTAPPSGRVSSKRLSTTDIQIHSGVRGLFSKQTRLSLRRVIQHQRHGGRQQHKETHDFLWDKAAQECHGKHNSSLIEKTLTGCDVTRHKASKHAKSSSTFLWPSCNVWGFSRQDHRLHRR